MAPGCGSATMPASSEPLRKESNTQESVFQYASSVSFPKGPPPLSRQVVWESSMDTPLASPDQVTGP